jgi:hypothetical protein
VADSAFNRQCARGFNLTTFDVNPNGLARRDSFR